MIEQQSVCSFKPYEDEKNKADINAKFLAISLCGYDFTRVPFLLENI